MNSVIGKFVGFGVEHSPAYRLPRSRGGKRLVCRKTATIVIDFVPPEEGEEPTRMGGFTKIEEEEERKARIPYLKGCAGRMRTPSEEGFQSWLSSGEFNPLTEEETTLLKEEIDLCNDMLRRRIPSEELVEWENRKQSALTTLGV